MKNKKILITGVSSGIGRCLVKKLIKDNHVWGIARRKKLLIELQKELGEKAKFIYSVTDVSNLESIKALVYSLTKEKFKPDIIILNSAILRGDVRKIFATNFFGILDLIDLLLPVVKKGSQFITISSSSSLKGSATEDIGYGASKAALSNAFESLHQRYKKQQIIFKIVFFGPVGWGNIGISYNQAVEAIIHASQTEKTLYYYPRSIFFVLQLCKLLPEKVYFLLLDKIDRRHTRLLPK